MNPFSFRDLRDMGSPVGLSPRQVSNLGSLATDQPGYFAQGQRGALGTGISHASAWLDDLFEDSYAQDVGEHIGETIGSTFGASEAGAEAGRSLPRQMANYAPAAIGAVFGGPIGIAGLVGSAGLTAGDVYEKTGSPWQALVSGGMVGIAPTVGNVTGRAALAAGGKMTGGRIGMTQLANGQKVLNNVPSKLTEYAGSTIGTEALFQGVAAAQSEDGFWNYFTDRDNIVQTLVEELPFALVDAVSTYKAPTLATARRKGLDVLESGTQDIEGTDVSDTDIPFRSDSEQEVKAQTVLGPGIEPEEQVRRMIGRSIADIQYWADEQKSAAEREFGDPEDAEFKQVIMEIDAVAQQARKLASQARAKAPEGYKETLLGMNPMEMRAHFLERSGPNVREGEIVQRLSEEAQNIENYEDGKQAESHLMGYLREEFAEKGFTESEVDEINDKLSWDKLASMPAARTKSEALGYIRKVGAKPSNLDRMLHGMPESEIPDLRDFDEAVMWFAKLHKMQSEVETDMLNDATLRELFMKGIEEGSDPVEILTFVMEQEAGRTYQHKDALEQPELTLEDDRSVDALNLAEQREIDREVQERRLAEETDPRDLDVEEEPKKTGGKRYVHRKIDREVTHDEFVKLRRAAIKNEYKNAEKYSIKAGRILTALKNGEPVEQRDIELYNDILKYAEETWVPKKNRRKEKFDAAVMDGRWDADWANNQPNVKWARPRGDERQIGAVVLKKMYDSIEFGSDGSTAKIGKRTIGKAGIMEPELLKAFKTAGFSETEATYLTEYLTHIGAKKWVFPKDLEQLLRHPPVEVENMTAKPELIEELAWMDELTDGKYYIDDSGMIMDGSGQGVTDFALVDILSGENKARMEKLQDDFLHELSGIEDRHEVYWDGKTGRRIGLFLYDYEYISSTSEGDQFILGTSLQGQQHGDDLHGRNQGWTRGKDLGETLLIDEIQSDERGDISWESRALEATFEKANMEGKRYVFVPNGETASRTQSSKKNYGPLYSRMQKHADKLTGQTGRSIDMGDHRNGGRILGKLYDIEGYRVTQQRLTKDKAKVADATFKQSLFQVLRGYGMSKKEAKAGVAMGQKVMEVMGVSPTSFGRIIGTNSRLSGAWVPQMDRIYLGNVSGWNKLSPKQQAEAHSFVVAHEIFHKVQDLAKTGELSQREMQAFNEYRGWLEQSSLDDRKDVLDLLQEEYAPHLGKEDLQNLSKDTENWEATVTGLLAVAKVKEREASNDPLVALVPKSIRNWWKLASRWADKIGKALNFQNDQALVNVAGMVKRFDKLTEELKVADRMGGQLHEFASMSHELLNETSFKFTDANEARGQVYQTGMDFEAALFKGKDSPDDPRNWVARAFRGVNGLTTFLDSFKGLRHTIVGHLREERSIMNRIMAPLFGDKALGATGELRGGFRKWKEIKEYERALQDPKINEVLSEMMTFQNDDASNQLKLQDFEKIKTIKDKLDKLSGDDKQLVYRQFSLHQEQNKTRYEETRKAYHESGKYSLAAYLTSKMHHNEFTDARKMANDVMNIAAMEDGPIKTDAIIKFRDMWMQREPMDGMNTADKALAIAQKWQEQLKKIDAQYASKPAAFSEIRAGRFEVSWTTVTGEIGNARVESMKKARLLKEQVMKDQKLTGGVFIKDTSTNDNGAPAIKSSTVDFLAQLDAERNQFIEGLNIDPEVKERLQGFRDFASEFFAEKGQLNLKNLPYHKTGKAGSEYLNMVDTQRVYSALLAKALANMQMNLRLKYEMANPRLEQFPAEKAQVMEIVNAYRIRDPKVGQKITELNFLRFMGLNFSSHILELSQPIFTILPQAINEVGIGQAFRAMRSATAAVGKGSGINLSKLGKASNKEMFEGEMVDVMEQAARDGAISHTFLSDTLDQDAFEAYATGKMARDGVVGKAIDLIPNGYSMYKKAATNAFAAAAHVNARIGLHMGWEMAKKKHPKLEAVWDSKGNLNEDGKLLMEEAYRFMDLSTFSGGRANRPGAPYAGNNPTTRTAMMAAFSLQGFNLGVLNQMVAYAFRGFAKNSAAYRNLTPKQRKNARKALAIQSSLFALATGVVGMPGVAAALAMIESNTELELNKEMREQLGKLTDDPMIQDMILHGVANKMSFGADVGSRLGVGIPGTDPYRGFEAANLAGPMGSTIADVTRAMRVLSEGGSPFSNRALEATEYAMPVPFKKLINLIRNEGEFRDMDGNLLIEGTPAQKLLYAVGFRPEELTRLREFSRMQRRSREIKRLEEKRWHDNLAELMDSNPVAVAEILRNREEETKGRYDARDGANRIANRKEQKRFKQDVRQDASLVGSGVEMDMLAASGRTSDAQNMERALYRNDILNILGQGGVTPRELQMAADIDQMMRMNPFMTKAEARYQIERSQLTSPALSSNLFPQSTSPFSG